MLACLRRVCALRCGSLHYGSVLVHGINVFRQSRCDHSEVLSDTFAGIRPIDAPVFILAQILGAVGATFLFRWLAPGLSSAARDILVEHSDDI